MTSPIVYVCTTTGGIVIYGIADILALYIEIGITDRVVHENVSLEGEEE